MFLYMAVTADRYELPLIVGTRQEVAAFASIRPESLTVMIRRLKNGETSGKFCHVKYIKIEVD